MLPFPNHGCPFMFSYTKKINLLSQKIPYILLWVFLRQDRLFHYQAKPLQNQHLLQAPEI